MKRTYGYYLKLAAKSMPTSAFSPWLWSGFWRSLLDVMETLVTFALLVIITVLYPVSVPIFAYVAMRRAQGKATQECKS